MSTVHVLFSEEEIALRVKELAKEIDMTFAPDRKIVVVTLLCGASLFAADLVRKMDRPVQMDFFAVSSYDGTRSTEKFEVRAIPKLDYHGKSVLLIDDILDTGLTMTFAEKYFRENGASEIRTCVLLEKEGGGHQFQSDWVGFSVSPKFVVGYGLDYNEDYRSLPYIGYLED